MVSEVVVVGCWGLSLVHYLVSIGQHDEDRVGSMLKTKIKSLT